MPKVDIEAVRDNYRRMTDDELVRIATKDARGLTPEAQEVVIDEIKNRNLDSKIISSVKAQNKNYTVEELDKYCAIIQKLECPICHSASQKLNATLTSEVISFVVMTTWKRKIRIACPHCLDKANNEALTNSVLFGWWGIPFGIIRTIQAIITNRKSSKTNHADSPNNFLRNVTLLEIGQIETYQDNKEMLQLIISSY